VHSSQACRQEGGAALFPDCPVLPRGFVLRGPPNLGGALGPTPRCETARRANLRSGTVHLQRCGLGLGGWAPGARDSNPTDPLGRPKVPVPRDVTWLVGVSGGQQARGEPGAVGSVGPGPGLGPGVGPGLWGQWGLGLVWALGRGRGCGLVGPGPGLGSGARSGLWGQLVEAPRQAGGPGPRGGGSWLVARRRAAAVAPSPREARGGPLWGQTGLAGSRAA